MEAIFQSEYAMIANPTPQKLADQLLDFDSNGEVILPEKESYVYDQAKDRINSAQVGRPLNYSLNYTHRHRHTLFLQLGQIQRMPYLAQEKIFRCVKSTRS